MIQILINGVDLATLPNTKVKIGSFNLSLRADNRHKCSLTLITTAASFIPRAGQDLQVFIDAELVFGGIIKTIPKNRPGAGTGVDTIIFVDITSDGFHSIPARRTVTLFRKNVTAGDIVRETIDKFLSQEGITEGTILAGASIDVYDQRVKSLKEVFDELADMSGFKWFIDNAKALQFKQEDPVVVAAHDIIEGGIFTDFRDVNVEENSDNYRNKQFVVGAVQDDGRSLFFFKELTDEILARQGIEGGTGVYGNVLQDTNINNLVDAETAADNLLKRHGKMPIELSFNSDATDWRAGTKLKVNLPIFDLSTDTFFLIENVTIRELPSGHLRSFISATLRDDAVFSTQRTENYIDYFSKLIKKQNGSSAVLETLHELSALSDNILHGLDANIPVLTNVLSSFNRNNAAGLGYRFSDATLWTVTSELSPTASQINSNTGAVLATWALVSAGNGAEIDGDDDDILWVTSGTSGLDKYRISTQSRISNFAIGNLNGVASPAGDFVWVATNSTPYKVEKRLKSDGSLIYSFGVDFSPSGVAWDGELVWVCGVSSQIQGFNPDTGVLVSEFTSPGATLYGLTFDGRNFWVVDGTNNLISSINQELTDFPNLYYATDTKKIYWNVNGTWTFVATLDHGLLEGLGDDDHTQYLNNTRHDTTVRHTLGSVVPHDDFIQLGDTPASYLGQIGKAVVVKSTEDGLEFGVAPSGGVFSQTFGDGVATTFDLVHNLNTQDLLIELWDLTTGATPQLATSAAQLYEAIDVNTVRITFSVAPAINKYRAVIISSGGVAGGSSNLIQEIEVTTATTTVQFTGLDIATIKDYVLVVEFVNPTVTNSILRMEYNGDTVASNYFTQLVYAVTTPSGANLPDENRLAYAQAGQESHTIANFAMVNGFITSQTTVTSIVPSDINVYMYYSARLVQDTNLTDILIRADVTGAIGAGSKFRLYKLKSEGGGGGGVSRQWFRTYISISANGSPTAFASKGFVLEPTTDLVLHGISMLTSDNATESIKLGVYELNGNVQVGPVLLESGIFTGKGIMTAFYYTAPSPITLLAGHRYTVAIRNVTPGATIVYAMTTAAVGDDLIGLLGGTYSRIASANPGDGSTWEVTGGATPFHGSVLVEN